MSLIASCITLVWAIVRLARLSKSSGKINKIMITMHIVDYLVMILSNFELSLIPITDLRRFEISYIT